MRHALHITSDEHLIWVHLHCCKTSRLVAAGASLGQVAITAHQVLAVVLVHDLRGILTWVVSAQMGSFEVA